MPRIFFGQQPQYARGAHAHACILGLPLKIILDSLTVCGIRQESPLGVALRELLAPAAQTLKPSRAISTEASQQDSRETPGQLSSRVFVVASVWSRKISCASPLQHPLVLDADPGDLAQPSPVLAAVGVDLETLPRESIKSLIPSRSRLSMSCRSHQSEYVCLRRSRLVNSLHPLRHNLGTTYCGKLIPRMFLEGPE